MNLTWLAFKKDRYFLTRYFLVHGAILGSLIATCIYVGRLSFKVDLNLGHLFLLPLSFLLGIQIPVLMHNCMHGNLKSKYANIIIGELSGFFVLMGLGILRINHTLHHAHSDTLEDPHSPIGKSFLKFLVLSQFSGSSIIKDKFLKFHGNADQSAGLFQATIFLHYFTQILRLVLWLLLLGPTYFIAFYLPAFIFYSLAFAHINYVTHKKNKSGHVEILNKDDNVYYQLINFIGSGVYYHRNHHLKPRLLDPRTAV